MKKIAYFTIVLLFALMSTGCTHGKAFESGKSCPVEKYQHANNLVRNSWNAFVQFSKQEFSKRVSNDFIPDKNTFLTEVEDSFYSAKPIDLFFTINKVLESKDKISVSLSWEKKVADRDTNALSLIKGKGTIVFINKNGQWLIYKIDETSIFTL